MAITAEEGREYQDRFGMTRDLMRTEISLRLTKYITELENALAEGNLKKVKEL